MLRLALSAVIAASAVLATPAIAPADAPSLMVKRSNSCGNDAFETLLSPDGAPSYRHKAFGVTGETYIGEAILEWCQTAQNAVIYFYVDDPGRKEHDACPENMSLAIFPGRGPETEQIIKANVISYANPTVRLIEEPRLGPIQLHVGAHIVDAYKLEAVMVDSAGHPRRQKMIGYNDDGAFVRVMTGEVEDPACANDVTKSFMAALNWPA